MIHAYDKIYLSVAQKCLAHMLDYMVNGLKYPLEKAWEYFWVSGLSRHFEAGDSSILAGTSGVELARKLLEQAGLLRITSGILGFDSRKLSRLCRLPRCGCCIRPTTRWMFASLRIR